MNSREYKEQIDAIMIGSGSLEEKQRLVQAFKQNNMICEVPSYRAKDQDPLTSLANLGINWFLIQGIFALVVTGSVFLKLSGGTSFGLPIALFGLAAVALGVFVVKKG